jgi:hypothetical protein
MHREVVAPGPEQRHPRDQDVGIGGHFDFVRAGRVWFIRLWVMRAVSS